jgi:hypothetical protein
MKEDINSIVYEALIKKAQELPNGEHHDIKGIVKIAGKNLQFGCDFMRIKNKEIELHNPFAVYI